MWNWSWRRDAGSFFDHQDDALIGMRLNPGFDQKRGGRLVNAEGLADEAGVWGQTVPLDRLDYGSRGREDRRSGVRPSFQFQSSTRWHVRSFGFLDANPFARHDFDNTAPDGSHPLEMGMKLRIRYRILIHPAGTDLNRYYQKFAK